MLLIRNQENGNPKKIPVFWKCPALHLPTLTHGSYKLTVPTTLMEHILVIFKVYISRMPLLKLSEGLRTELNRILNSGKCYIFWKLPGKIVWSSDKLKLNDPSHILFTIKSRQNI